MAKKRKIELDDLLKPEDIQEAEIEKEDESTKEKKESKKSSKESKENSDKNQNEKKSSTESNSKEKEGEDESEIIDVEVEEDKNDKKDTSSNEVSNEIKSPPPNMAIDIYRKSAPSIYKYGKKAYDFSSTWTGTIIIVLVLIFFVAQSFVIPSGSMKRTLLIGDFLFAKKFSYGVPLPELPWVGVKILPDFMGNGHLISGPRPKREDIVIFYVPKDKKTHFVKRCVAVGGDEILFFANHLLIHFHEGDEYIKKNYPSSKIKKVLGKLWVDNPYKEKYPGIQYQPEYKGNSFLMMIYRGENYGDIDMKPLLIPNLTNDIFTFKGQAMNVFYKKIEPDHYYMIGDNRDNSEDSRFWGSVPYSLIIGKPWVIYFSIEYRSYNRVMFGQGGGRDHQSLKAVCKDVPLDSVECREAWNRHRYTIRWNRIWRDVESFQFERPRDY